MLMKYKDLGKVLSKDEMKNVKGGINEVPGCRKATCGTGNWCGSSPGPQGIQCYCFGSFPESGTLRCPMD
jgi:bacteriocin-like protein